MNSGWSLLGRLVAASALLGAATIVAVSCGGGGKGGVAPQANGTLTGPIEISGKASSGTITLTVSEDGKSITFVTVLLKDLKCDGFSAGSSSTGVAVKFPVAGGNLNGSPPSLGKISGHFSSPTEASGKVDLKWDMGGVAPCELGEWKWSAKLAANDVVDIPVYAGVKEAALPGGFPVAEMSEVAGIREGDYEKVVWKHYTSDATAKDIMDWYRSEMTKSKYGWTETFWNDVSGQGAIGVWSKDGEKSAALVAAATDSGGNGTQLAIMEALNKK